jgi:hypothetical protein
VTSRYGRKLEFGLSVAPETANVELVRSLAVRADELGLDLIGIQTTLTNGASSTPGR